VPNGERPLVMLSAGTHWYGPRMLDHHLARELARYADVLYVEPATSFLSRWRNPLAAQAARSPGLETVEPGVQVLRPRVNPLMERRVGKPLALRLTRRAMRRAAQRDGRPVRAMVLMSLNPLFGAVGERCRVFYAGDDLAAGAGLMGISDPGLVARSVWLPRQADIVAAVSPPLVENLRAAGVQAMLIPNGVDVPHFSRAVVTEPDPQVHDLGPRTVGFVGHLGDRIDPGVIAAVADRDCTVVLVGPRRRAAGDWLDDLLRRPNVHWVGPRPYAELPAVLAAAKVWMLPYTDTAFNRASFPLKLLEYLAAGRRVVSTDLPAVRWLDTDLIETSGEPEVFADAVLSELDRPPTAQESGRRVDFAAGHEWRERIRPLAEQMGLIR